ncbi:MULTISPECIES: hypothetical protein [Psychrilyobacter]|uniref:YeeE/YedE family protein n=1 Tax=Psychrilyobacter piezotolerans TaxID=2293438 RepID=A0ABX9KGZ0_9FUSO|nr:MULTISPECIES: hypothetical protein [Psychrilyobacter]MCS5421510.1 hypothetical protein [Psychrilyobacter sp. S5]NDI77737.1 hypothetical protein [Psychrilyobacter piezotolerans]RDE61435.1 hypothetical protein DV867_09000 [Psychrilyobacter sp. S5]REI40956.1 hypothetical protein DYH56_09000 [Psychrilyobacter piezotolerans]
MTNLNKILRDKSSRRIGFLAGLIYFILYLYSVGDISLENDIQGGIFFLSNWRDVIFKMKSTFIWEAVGVISGKNIYMAISPLNILLGVILSGLIFVNISTALYAKKHPGSCPLGMKTGFLGVFASFLGGFACCVPTFIIVLGPIFSGLTLFFIKIRVFLIPGSLLILIWGAIWGVKRVK